MEKQPSIYLSNFTNYFDCQMKMKNYQMFQLLSSERRLILLSILYRTFCFATDKKRHNKLPRMSFQANLIFKNKERSGNHDGSTQMGSDFT